MQVAIFLVALTLWLFVLHALNKANLRFWHFAWGSIGLFILLMVFIKPLVTRPLALGVTGLAGIVGSLTDTFDAYFKYGIIFVQNAASSITLKIDMECSGIIEIMAFVSLVSFFRVYTKYERLFIAVLGSVVILLANVVRIILICEIVHFCGTDAFAIAHTFIGRFFFYGATVLLYFYVFTRPQIISMQLRSHKYDKLTDVI